MIKSYENILKEIANNSEMKGNIISFVLAEHPFIDLSKRDRVFDIIQPLYNSFKEKKRQLYVINKEETESIERFKGDYRINNIKISNVRGFPHSEKPFGIDLTEGGEPVSMVILGTNGVGKSSIYNAVEFSFCRRVGEAELRSNNTFKDNSEDFEKYLQRFNNDFNDAKCIIQTKKTDLNIQEEYFTPVIRKQLNPDTHFISDFDIYKNGQLNFEGDDEYSFHHLVAESIGLTEILRLNTNLKSFIQYRRNKEKINNSALQKESKTLSESLNLWKKSLDEKKKEIDTLEKQKGDPKEDEKLKTVSELLASLKQNNYSVEYNTENISSVNSEFKKQFELYSSLNVEQKNQNEYDFLKFGFELIGKYNNCPFCNSSTKDTTQLKEYVNKRIVEIKETGEIRQKLNNKTNELIEEISTLLSQVDRIELGINTEVERIKEFSEFAKLAQGELQFLSYTSEYLGNDFFNDSKQIRGILTENQEKKLSRVNNFIETNKVFIENELIKFLDRINQFISFRINAIQEIEKLLTEKTQQFTIIEKIGFLKKEILDIELQTNNAEKRIKSIDEEVKKNDITINAFQEIKDQIIEYQSKLETIKNDEVNSAFTPIKEITESILQEYFKDENRSVNFEINKEPIADKETGEVLSEIIVAKIFKPDSPDKPISPNKYFNTFHYRLFSAMIGISIAVASRIKTEINLPLVLDDVFYASDLQNRTTIEKFIRHLFQVFKKHTPNQPLQLILFTHDELIFDCANATIIENDLPKVVFSKLFHYSEAEEMDNYKELTYRIPVDLPQTLFEALR